MGFVKRLVTNPSQFFARVSADTGVRGPVLIVLLSGITSLVASGQLLLFSTAALPEGVQAILLIPVAVTVVAQILSVYIVWVLYAVVFYLLLFALGASTEFRELVLATGWGFFPQVLSSALLSGGIVYALSQVEPPSDLQAFESFATVLQGHPAITATTLATVPFILWSGMLWTFAIENTSDASIKQAVLVAAVPVVFSLYRTLNGVV